jgi:hypothetical protein
MNNHAHEAQARAADDRAIAARAAAKEQPDCVSRDPLIKEATKNGLFAIVEQVDECNGFSTHFHSSYATRAAAETVLETLQGNFHIYGPPGPPIPGVPF